MIDEKKKTLTEWAEEYGFTVLDPDGFDRRDPELAVRLFTRKEWDSGWPRCTLSCIRAGQAYHGTPAFAAPETVPPGGWQQEKASEPTMEEAWAGLPEGAKLNARALALAVHDGACWACARGLKECPKRREIESLGSDE